VFGNGAVKFGSVLIDFIVTYFRESRHKCQHHC